MIFPFYFLDWRTQVTECVANSNSEKIIRAFQAQGPPSPDGRPGELCTKSSQGWGVAGEGSHAPTAAPDPSISVNGFQLIQTPASPSSLAGPLPLHGKVKPAKMLALTVLPFSKKKLESSLRTQSFCTAPAHGSQPGILCPFAS